MASSKADLDNEIAEMSSLDMVMPGMASTEGQRGPLIRRNSRQAGSSSQDSAERMRRCKTSSRECANPRITKPTKTRAAPSAPSPEAASYKLSMPTFERCVSAGTRSAVRGVRGTLEEIMARGSQDASAASLEVATNQLRLPTFERCVSAGTRSAVRGVRGTLEEIMSRGSQMASEASQEEDLFEEMLAPRHAERTRAAASFSQIKWRDPPLHRSSSKAARSFEEQMASFDGHFVAMELTPMDANV